MNEEYIDNVKHLIEQKDADKVKGLLIDLHPADIAELCNDLNAEEAKFVYRLLDNEIAADVLVEMDEDARKELLEMLPSETIAKRFVDYMDTDDAVDLMRELDEDKQEELNEKLQTLIAYATKHPTVSVTYFKPDDKKTGGEYVTATGIFQKFRDYERTIVLEDGTDIECDRIVEIRGI
mgnify:FL=1